MTARVVAAVIVRPWLWATAAREVVRFAPAGWWRRWPPVPRPDESWVAFRLETQYGSSGATATPPDVVAWLEWCRSSARR